VPSQAVFDELVFCTVTLQQWAITLGKVVRRTNRREALTSARNRALHGLASSSVVDRTQQESAAICFLAQADSRIHRQLEVKAGRCKALPTSKFPLKLDFGGCSSSCGPPLAASFASASQKLRPLAPTGLVRRAVKFRRSTAIFLGAHVAGQLRTRTDLDAISQVL